MAIMQYNSSRKLSRLQFQYVKTFYIKGCRRKEAQIICIDVCKCKLLMSSVFCFHYACFHLKSLVSPEGFGFHDVKLYACIYQMEYVTVIK